MIAKRVHIRQPKKSSFAGLARYITDAQSKSERVGDVRVTNCANEDVSWAVREIEHTQQQNRRAASDKTYHLLFSFPVGESPSADTLRAIEDRICAGLGFADHQRISAIHTDTDNLHIHVAINKIHPTQLTIHEPKADYARLGGLCAALEEEFGLQRTNHARTRSAGEDRALDMERMSGIESLLSFTRRECLEGLKVAATWAAVHDALNDGGLHLAAKGNGFIIADSKGVSVKASTIHRDLSRKSLEARLGPFEPMENSHARKAKPNLGFAGSKPPPPLRNRLRNLSDVHVVSFARGSEMLLPDDVRRRMEHQGAEPHHSLRWSESRGGGGARVGQARYERRPVQESPLTAELYGHFEKEDADRRAMRSLEWRRARAERDRRLDKLKNTSRFKRAALKLARGRLAKTFLYASITRTHKAEREKILADYAKEQAEINSRFARPSWTDWLAQQAKAGDDKALSALRERDGRRIPSSRTVAGATPGKVRVSASLDSVTKNGTIIYRVGEATLKDYGEHLYITRASSSQALTAALALAVEKYGSKLSITGDEAFQAAIAKAAVNVAGLTFSDPAMEARRQQHAASLSSPAMPAALRYVDERNNSRAKGIVIPEHRLYNSADAGRLSFVGVRQVDGYPLALVRKDDQVLVVPSDEKTIHRLKRLSVGEPVTLTDDGKLFIKTQSRRL